MYGGYNRFTSPVYNTGVGFGGGGLYGSGVGVIQSPVTYSTGYGGYGGLGGYGYGNLTNYGGYGGYGYGGTCPSYGYGVGYGSLRRSRAYCGGNYGGYGNYGMFWCIYHQNVSFKLYCLILV